MPQISLYVDEPTLKKIETAAKRQHVSISKWVSEQLRTRIEPVYPLGFEDLFGSISDETFVRHEEPAFSLDSPRASM